VSSEPNDLLAPPPGQRWVARLPIQHVGDPPHFDGLTWSLSVLGAVGRPRVYSLAELYELSTIDIQADFHSGTGWSVRKLRWRGARLSDVLDAAQIAADARCVRFADGVRYDAVLLPAAASEPDVVLATALDGDPLPLAHGGPVRLVAPAKYGWKSVKWLRSIEVLREEHPGFWERRGFDGRADPWLEQRFA
jgi:DMSO/TMAO reductase YedYZ molybdopterin-dependent catalytic subunit